jgi:hypothetical protein
VIVAHDYVSKCLLAWRRKEKADVGANAEFCSCNELYEKFLIELKFVESA